MASADRRSDFLPRLLALRRSSLFLSLVVLWVLFLDMEIARPCFFLHDDNACWFIGAYLHDFNTLIATGRVAEVNYYQHGGEPFLEQGQSAVLYPPVYLGAALARGVSGDMRWTLEWIALEHLTVGLIGFYFWLRRGGVGANFAALGALVWVCNPFALTVSASWIFAIYVVAWLPWLFWALDRLLAQPSAGASLYLGIFAGLLFLQGYVQYFAYAILFLAIYALFAFALRNEARRSAVFFYLFVSMLVFSVLALPLLLPMLHALNQSAMRGAPLTVAAATFYSVTASQIGYAQLGLFSYFVVFGTSTAILFCPALLFVPVMAYSLYDGGREARRRLVPLIVLALLALALSTTWHGVLSVLPVFDRFRWPFKVFLFADFFLIAALVGTAAALIKARPSRWVRFPAGACLAAVVVASVAVSLDWHDDSVFSVQVVDPAIHPLLPGMHPELGRVAAFSDDDLPQQMGQFYLTRGYATYHAFPSIGGYNPLISKQVLAFAILLDYPNICTEPLTPDFQKYFEARAVRYWMVDPHSPQFAAAQGLPGLKVLEATADRVVYEDARAAPLAYVTGRPGVPVPQFYSGNSIRIPIPRPGLNSSLSVSVAPTDGWWYRFDQGPWLKPVDEDDRLIIPCRVPDRELEITYFDPRFRLGLGLSTGLLLLVGLLLFAGRRLGAQPRS